MKKEERIQNKIFAKKYYRIGYSLAIFGLIMLILIMVLPLNNFINAHCGLIFMGVFILLSIVPILLSLIFVSMGSTKINQLREYKNELLDKQNKFHMKLFWEAVRSNDFEEAKRLYNIKDFIWGSERVLCNGILMGIATQVRIDEDWSERVDDRMNSYFL